jgi:hypothetical protein
MTNLEIKQRIDSNNKIIQDAFRPNQFVLNNVIKNLLKENEDLQKQCTHSFVDGYCEYCYMEEPTKK